MFRAAVETNRAEQGVPNAIDADRLDGRRGGKAQPPNSTAGRSTLADRHSPRRSSAEPLDDLLLRYDAVLLLDDDVVLSSPALSRFFFSEMERSSLNLAAILDGGAACGRSSSSPRLARACSAVEIMMPAATRSTLERAGWTFGRAISGYGVDLLGHEIVDRLGGKAGVIGRWSPREKPIDDRNGNFYTYTRSLGINPKHELWTIMKEFGIEAALSTGTGAFVPVRRRVCLGQAPGRR